VEEKGHESKNIQAACVSARVYRVCTRINVGCKYHEIGVILSLNKTSLSRMVCCTGRVHGCLRVVPRLLLLDDRMLRIRILLPTSLSFPSCNEFVVDTHRDTGSSP
jgi:hypothetical protein